MNKPTSRYHEVYARWLRDPEGFWADAAQEIDWYEPARKVFDPAAGVYGRWFVGGVCNTCYNAVDRHVARRPRRAGGDHLRLAGHRHQARDHLRRAAGRGGDARRHPAGLRRRQGRPRHHLHADGPGGGGRDARLRAHRRDPLGGVRRLRGQGARHPHRRRQAEAHPLRDLRHRAEPRRALQAAARSGDRARHGTSPRPAHPAAAAGARRRLSAGRDHDWAALRAPRWPPGKTAPTACRCWRPIRSTSSTRPARPASPRASCATTAATWSR